MSFVIALLLEPNLHCGSDSISGNSDCRDADEGAAEGRGLCRLGSETGCDDVVRAGQDLERWRGGGACIGGDWGHESRNCGRGGDGSEVEGGGGVAGIDLSLPDRLRVGGGDGKE